MPSTKEDGESSVDYSDDGLPPSSHPSRSSSPLHSSSSSDSSPTLPHPPILPPPSQRKSIFAVPHVTPQAGKTTPNILPDTVPTPIITQLIERLPPEVKTLQDMVQYFHSSVASVTSTESSDGFSSSRPADHERRRPISSSEREPSRVHRNMTLLPQAPRPQVPRRQLALGTPCGRPAQTGAKPQDKEKEGQQAGSEREPQARAVSPRTRTTRSTSSRSPFTWLCRQCSRRVSHTTKCNC